MRFGPERRRRRRRREGENIEEKLMKRVKLASMTEIHTDLLL